jgi:hypothetical protein
MLLHGDGTNGAQNNTFLDSSTNNFTITRNGNTTQGSFSPYGSNWSNYIDGSSYLAVSNGGGSALDMGTGNCTIEMWVNPATQTTSFPSMFAPASGWSTGTFYIRYSDGGNSKFGIFWNSVGDPFFQSTNTYSPNAWYHVALVRNGTTFTLYVNGVADGTGTSSASLNLAIGGSVWLGNNGSASCNFKGYLSNVRVVKGTAVYTSNFTPSTTPLTAISGTSLLTCQNNRFIDTSASPLTITTSGTPSVQRFNPFGTSTAYSTSVIGGSGYFDGSGDYLNTANSSAFAFGTGDFTVECWINTGSNNVGLAEVDGGSTGYWMWHINAGTMSWQNTRGGANLFLITGAGAVCDNAWHHLAIVRNSSVTKAYWDGVEKASASDTTNYSGTGGNLNVAYETAAGKILNGYMANFRIVKGTAVYTSAFTPPTAPLTSITNTSILTNFQNAAIFDNAMMNDLETVGNAQISTSVKKYGTGSLAFDGTGDYLKIPSTSNLAFGTGDFTFECWFYPLTLPADVSTMYSSNNDATTSGTITINVFDDGKVKIGDLYATSSSLSTNAWSHIAICRASGTLRIFINGTQGSSNSVSTNYTSDGGYIGARKVSGTTYAVTNGYIDDLRITKGYARYTANFTTPTSALSDTGPY